MMSYEGYDVPGYGRALVSPCAGMPCGALYDYPEAYPLTSSEAVQAVRDRLCPVSAWWCSASASEIINRVCTGTEQLFTGTGCGDGDDWAIRCGLGCPTAAQTAACGSCTGTPPAAGGMNTALVVGGLVVVGALAFYIASQGKKKVIIARVEK